MPTTPPPHWPVETTLLFMVSYYANNSISTSPAIIFDTMLDYNSAITKAKELITANGNFGVCTIQQVTATVVYPSIPWEDF